MSLPPPTHTTTTLILATGNPHKVAELRAIFTPALAARVLSLSDFPHIAFHEPAETGATFEQNATIKALSYAAQLAAHGVIDVLVLADDSGIEIDALKLHDGAPRPGVISSHYSTDGVETGLTRSQRDAANNARILRELEGLLFEQRSARFVCVIALASAAGPESGQTVLHLTRGTFEGRIGLPPRIPAGSNGFGYDPLFLVAPDFARTGAELSSDEKNRLSHRAAAAKFMAEWLCTNSQLLMP